MTEKNYVGLTGFLKKGIDSVRRGLSLSELAGLHLARENLKDLSKKGYRSEALGHIYE